MDDAVEEMTRQDVWDDSALVQSWNEALAEYKKYHSIHATGRSLDSLLTENEQHAKPETQLHQHPQSAPRLVDAEADEGFGDAKGSNADTATDGAAATEDRIDGQEKEDLAMNDGATRRAFGQSQSMEHASASVMPPPQALLGSVQDENLKRLLMSWYYAGFCLKIRGSTKASRNTEIDNDKPRQAKAQGKAKQKGQAQ